MKFIDEATIIVQSGNGGRGCVSFRRERFAPRGGPDGGDGGIGGDVVLKATSNKRTLYHIRFRQEYKAENGQAGQGSQKYGRGGKDHIIDVPVGTLVYNAETGELLHDLVNPDEPVVVARGGRGGRGNLHFKTSTNRAPHYAQPGEPGERLTLKLELKLMADVGIIGVPNAGKSTLISAISSARPKIADYPFTTLTPNLGVVAVPDAEPFVIADIPGLIEGAHEGAGLGIRFLRHVERTRLLVHLIDCSGLSEEDPLQSYRTIRHELTMYSDGLAQKPELVVLNKLDVSGSGQLADRFCQALPDREVLRISAVTHLRLEHLKTYIRRQLDILDESL
ncbi:MAG: GTPase ObgE [Desulfobacteraceae bacterium]|nr:MAG: GTPase ObgE [Desulfobacteraceae bacterium]